MAEDFLKLFRLDGASAFVSGAAGHLGRAMTFALAQAGAHVIINGRDESCLKDFEGELKSSGHACERACFDVADADRCRAFFSARQKLDIIVNNAVSMTPAPFEALEPSAFEATYKSSVTAAFEIVRAARGALKASGKASVINISSMYGAVSPDPRIYDDPRTASPFHYGPAKAALIQLTRHLAAELGRDAIRVNALVPGAFPRAADPAFEGRLGTRTMLGRTGRPGEIAGPLLFLASPASSYVTGTTLTVDGGWTAW